MSHVVQYAKNVFESCLLLVRPHQINFLFLIQGVIKNQFGHSPKKQQQQPKKNNCENPNNIKLKFAYCHLLLPTMHFCSFNSLEVSKLWCKHYFGADFEKSFFFN